MNSRLQKNQLAFTSWQKNQALKSLRSIMRINTTRKQKEAMNLSILQMGWRILKFAENNMKL